MSPEQERIMNAPRYRKRALVEFTTTSRKGMTAPRRGNVIGILDTNKRGWWVCIELPRPSRRIVKARPNCVKLVTEPKHV